MRTDELLNGRGVLRLAVNDVREAQAKARTRHPDWYRGYASLEALAVQPAVCGPPLRRKYWPSAMGSCNHKLSGHLGSASAQVTGNPAWGATLSRSLIDSRRNIANA